jgi:prepilin-type N-terminal cleavage/methylation domain-containing protein
LEGNLVVPLFFQKKGFTLVELVVALFVLAVLLLMAIPQLNLSGNRAASAARKLLSDLRYAQQLANATQTRHGVNFNSSTQYTVFKSDDSAVAAADPLKGGNFVVGMNGDFAGVTLSNNFTGGIIRFDSLGVPYEGANGSQTALSAARTISVAAGGSTVKTITIEPTTGKVWMN